MFQSQSFSPQRRRQSQALCTDDFLWKIEFDFTAERTTFVQNTFNIFDTNSIQDMQIKTIILRIGRVHFAIELALHIIHTTQQLQQRDQTLCISRIDLSHITHYPTRFRINQSSLFTLFFLNSWASPHLDAQTRIQQIHFHKTNILIHIPNPLKITQRNHGQTTNQYNVPGRILCIRGQRQRRWNRTMDT
jgi:hypothetical protein